MNIYGRFDRIYSLQCFGFVRDESIAFRNVARLLSADGEALISTIVIHPVLDAWKDVHKMCQWNSLVPDPAEVFPSAVRFHYAGTMTQIERETRSRVNEAGLECLVCHVQMVTWCFENIGQIFDRYSEGFRISAGVPPAEHESLKSDFSDCLHDKITQTQHGCECSLGIYRVVAKLR